MQLIKFYIPLQDILDRMITKIYLEGKDGPELINPVKSIKVWKAFELELVAIRRLFLKNTIHIATQLPVKACKNCGKHH